MLSARGIKGRTRFVRPSTEAVQYCVRPGVWHVVLDGPLLVWPQQISLSLMQAFRHRCCVAYTRVFDTATTDARAHKMLVADGGPRTALYFPCELHAAHCMLHANRTLLSLRIVCNIPYADVQEQATSIKTKQLMSTTGKTHDVAVDTILSDVAC